VVFALLLFDFFQKQCYNIIRIKEGRKSMVSLDMILQAKYVGDIFSNDKTKIKSEYKELSKRWHPDLNGNSEQSNKAMSTINIFYAKALELLEKHEWEKSNYTLLKTIDKKTFEINYKSVFDFELGKFYVCDKAIVFLVGKKFSSLYENYKRTIKNLKYPSDKMKEEIERFIPKIILEFETIDYYVMKIEKEDSTFSLIDVHRFYNNQIPDKHVAWILSRLYNLVCFLDYNKISHNALTIESLFVNPEHHGIFLYGGWWFSCPLGTQLRSVPKKVYNTMPYQSKSTAVADRRIDLETIRMVARQLLGDEYGAKILGNREIPQVIKDWVLGKSGKTALGEYQLWDETLNEAYGKRVFIKMDINRTNLYH
jgi:hypothetical protein